MKRKLILFGAGILSELNLYYLSKLAKYEIVAITCSRSFIKDDSFQGFPVVPWENVYKIFPPLDHDLFISIGPVQLNDVRAQIYREAKNLGYHVISYIDPNASIWTGFDSGEHQFIGAGVEIQPYATVGNNVYIYNNSIIGHHSRIENHCFISAGVIIGGGVLIGERCFVGLGAIIRDGINIAPSCIIGAGAVILEDLKENGVYMAKPAYKLPIEPRQAVGLRFDA